MRVLCTEMGGRRITVQNGCIGDTTTGGSIALNGRTAVIEAGAPADFVGVPGSRGGVEIDWGWDRRGHRAGWDRGGRRGVKFQSMSWMVSSEAVSCFFPLFLRVFQVFRLVLIDEIASSNGWLRIVKRKESISSRFTTSE